jgi:maltooligosyltrehalose trehalohydrolase
MLELYRQLIRLRAAEPELADPRLDRVRVDFDEQRRWIRIERGRFRILVNLADRPQRVPVGGTGSSAGTGSGSGSSAGSGSSTWIVRLATGTAERAGDHFELGPESAAIVELG